MKIAIRRLAPIFAISILLIACSKNQPKTIILENDNIKFVSIGKHGDGKSITDPNQISTIVNAVEKAVRTNEILKPTNPNRTPEEDYLLQVYYDPAVQREAVNSFFVWADKEKHEVEIAPVQKGTTYLYQLPAEVAQPFIQLTSLSEKRS